MKTVLANLGLYEHTWHKKKKKNTTFAISIWLLIIFYYFGVGIFETNKNLKGKKIIPLPTLIKHEILLPLKTPPPKSLSQIFKVSWNFVRYSLNCIFILCSVLQKVAWLKDIKLRGKMWIEKNKTLTVIWNTKSTASNLLIVPIEVYWIAWIRWWINVAFYFMIVICHVKLRVIYEKHYSNF